MRILVVFIVSMAFVACKHEIPSPDGLTLGLGECHPDTVYFEQDILPFLLSNCAFSGCHDAVSQENGVNLTNYNSIFNTGDIRPGDPEGSDLYEVIVDDDIDDRMPPAPEYDALTIDQILMIRNWILQGGLNNSCDGCPTSPASFQSNVGALISSKCEGCHSGSTPDGGVLLTNYEEIRTQALFGTLYDAIAHNGNAVNMPYNSGQLPQCEIDLILEWIENDAPL